MRLNLRKAKIYQSWLTLFTCALASLSVLHASLALASDIDIYLGAPELKDQNGDVVVEAGAKPNILMIIDTSLSMNQTDIQPTRFEAMRSVLIDLIERARRVNIGLMQFTYNGGAVVYPVADLDQKASVFENNPDLDSRTEPITLSYKVMASEDDATEVTDNTVEPEYLRDNEKVKEGIEVPRGTVFLTGANIDENEASPMVFAGRRYSIAVEEEKIATMGIANLKDDGYEIAEAGHGSGDGSGYSVVLTDSVVHAPRDKAEGIDPVTDDTMRSYRRPVFRFSFNTNHVPRPLPSEFEGETTITGVKLELTYAEDRPDYPDGAPGRKVAFNIAVEDTEDASGFSNPSLSISDRNWTDESEGSPLSARWVPQEAQQQKETTVVIGDDPEESLIELIQRIVDKQSPEGDPYHIAFSMRADDGGDNENNGTQGYYTHSFYQLESDRNTDKSAKLTIEYTEAQAATINEKRTVGLRFRDVRIPNGAAITHAQLVLRSFGQYQGETKVTIRGEKVPNASAYRSEDHDISRRVPTNARVDWHLRDELLNQWVPNVSVGSEDISRVITEIVHQDSWCGGNALALILEGEDSEVARFIHSFDSDPDKAAELYITYIPEANPDDTGCTVSGSEYTLASANADAVEKSSAVDVSSDELDMSGTKVGLHFSGIDLIKESGFVDEIVDARLILKSSVPIDSGSMTIKGERQVNPPLFDAVAGNISGRETTGASVDWDVNASDSVGSTLSSPNIAAIIQEIIELPDWTRQSSLALILSADLPESIHAYESNVIDGVTLKILVKGEGGEDGPRRNFITVRDRLVAAAENLATNATTPTEGAFKEALYYLSGKEVGAGRHGSGRSRGHEIHYGADPEDETTCRFTDDGAVVSEPCPIRRLTFENPYVYNSRLSTPLSYTPSDAAIYRHPLCSGHLLLHNPFCWDEHIGSSETAIANPLPKYNSPIEKACQVNHVVLLTDGQPDANEDGLGYVVQLAETDLREDVEATQVAKVHAVGIKLDIPYLQRVTDTGKGQYYSVDTGQQLSTALSNIIGEALNSGQTLTAPAVATKAANSLQPLDEIYYGVFKPATHARWLGNLKGLRLHEGEIVDKEGRIAVEGGLIKQGIETLWCENDSGCENDGPDIEKGGVGYHIVKKGYSSRKVYTHLGTGAIEEFTTVNINDGLLSDELVDWVRGKDVYDQDGDGNITETRYSMGAPLHSQPIAINYGRSSGDETAPGDQVKLLVNTNAGLIHLFDAETGNEDWAFIPKEVFPMQASLKDNLIGSEPIYTIDGPPMVYIDDRGHDGVLSSSQGDRVYAYFISRRGGSSLYALDITDFSAPRFLWHLDSSAPGFSALGQAWSKPVFTKVKTSRGIVEALVFGGGYDEAYDDPHRRVPVPRGNAVYIVDAVTGELLLSISGSGQADISVSEMRYPIPSEISVQDLYGYDGVTDRLYFGDLGGQVWRVDLSDAIDSGNNRVKRLALLARSAFNSTRRFFYKPLVVPFHDGGRIRGQPTFNYILLTSGDRESPFDQTVENRFYALKDSEFARRLGAAGNLVESDPEIISEQDLYNATRNLMQNDNTGVQQAQLDGAKGWYIKMLENPTQETGYIGEKGLASGQVRKGTWFLTTYIPTGGIGVNSNDCSAGVIGATRFYALNLNGGGAVFNNFDGNDADLDIDDRRLENSELPVPGMIDVFVEAADANGDVSTIIGFSASELPGISATLTGRMNRTYWWDGVLSFP